MILLLGASASGKTEIAKYLSSHFGIQKAITSTTRPPREGEKNGVDYFFYSKREFEERIEKNLFVEHTIYHDNYYGTGADQVGPKKCIVLDPMGIIAFQKLEDPSIVSFYLYAEEKTRTDRMLGRGDSPIDVQGRIQNDRISFAKEKIPLMDFVLKTDNRTIASLANEIYEDYQNTLKKKGIVL